MPRPVPHMPPNQLDTLPRPEPVPNMPTSPPKIPPNLNQSELESESPSIGQSEIVHMSNKQLQVYSRRPRKSEEVEIGSTPKHHYKYDLDSNVQENTSGNVETDIDIPIAKRKGVRSYTQYPIANYFSYDRLSPEFRAFTTKISIVEVPQTIEDALKSLEWKQAVN